MEKANNQLVGEAGGVKLMPFFKKVGKKIASLFEPEEVIVTFKIENNKLRYTYTKVEHKQLA